MILVVAKKFWKLSWYYFQFLSSHQVLVYFNLRNLRKKLQPMLRPSPKFSSQHKHLLRIVSITLLIDTLLFWVFPWRHLTRNFSSLNLKDNHFINFLIAAGKPGFCSLFTWYVGIFSKFHLANLSELINLYSLWQRTFFDDFKGNRN